ncbi:MAG: DUF6320 domain-containing protein [Bacillota bacterium]|nr:DUF6320 domain-containing protein [Bacillota bacterium]
MSEPANTLSEPAKEETTWLPSQRCAVCEVTILGAKRACPLCQNPLSPDGWCAPTDTDPKLPQDAWVRVEVPEHQHLALRILGFVSIALVVSSFVLWWLFPIPIRWPLILLLALASMWLSLASILHRRRRFARIVNLQLSLLVPLAVIWDFAIGWRGWSLDYAIPFLCIAAMGTLYITALSLRLDARDYLIYLLLIAALSLLPLVFLLLDLVSNPLPSLLSVALAVLLFAAIILFQGAAMKAELERRLHL